MILESSAAIKDFLARYRDFGECILEDVRWQHFGTVIDLVFDYIWNDDGTVRPEYATEKRITVRLYGVQELHVNNALNEHMSLHPDELNWGLSEVSSVRLVEDEHALMKYRSLPLPLHHLRCNWQGERRIDILFATMQEK